MTGHLEVLKAVGVRFAVTVDLNNDYQGNVAAVVTKGSWSDCLDDDEEIGLLIVGYGSCSGCDVWQSLDGDPRGKLDTTRQALDEIKWFDNLAQLQAFVAGAPVGEDSWSADHALKWYGHDREFPQFQHRVAALKNGDLLEGVNA